MPPEYTVSYTFTLTNTTNKTYTFVPSSTNTVAGIQYFKEDKPVARDEEQVTEMIGNLQDMRALVIEYTEASKKDVSVWEARPGLSDLVVYDALHDLEEEGWLRWKPNKVMRAIIERNFRYDPFNSEDWDDPDSGFYYHLRTNLQQYMPEAMNQQCDYCDEAIVAGTQCDRCNDEDELDRHSDCCEEHIEEDDA